MDDFRAMRFGEFADRKVGSRRIDWDMYHNGVVLEPIIYGLIESFMLSNLGESGEPHDGIIGGELDNLCAGFFHLAATPPKDLEIWVVLIEHLDNRRGVIIA